MLQSVWMCVEVHTSTASPAADADSNQEVTLDLGDALEIEIEE